VLATSYRNVGRSTDALSKVRRAVKTAVRQDAQAKLDPFLDPQPITCTYSGMASSVSIEGPKSRGQKPGAGLRGKEERECARERNTV